MRKKTLADPSWGERERLRLLNKDQRRVDGPAKLTGAARYTHDIRLPGMVYGRVLLCPYPKAKASLDLGPARSTPGVVAVIEIETETLRLGQAVAAVAAETPEAAEDGVRAIVAEWNQEGFVVTREQSLAEGAPEVSRRGNTSRWSDRGDEEAVEAALAASDVTVEATYTLPVQHHCSLETHGVVVDYRGGDEATVYASTQGTFTIASDAAETLGLPANKVRCLVEHMGGGFGSKFGLGMEGQVACRLAKELERPVHLMLTRAQEFLTAGNRSGSHQVLRGGARASDGKMTALHATIDRLGGVGGGSHPGHPYIYSPEVAYARSRSVFTNTDANRAMRAPGHPQASFAIEAMVDELAYAIGMDPLSFRMANLADPIYHRQLERVAREVGWYEHPHRTAPGVPNGDRPMIGIGFGVSTWGGGGRPACEVEVRIERDGSVSASVGSQDLGTGTRTYIAGIVAEELGLEIPDVTARIGDSRLGRANASGGSTTTPSLAPAVKDAAHQAREAFFAQLAPVVDADPSELSLRPGGTVAVGDEARLSWSEACSALPQGGLSAQGRWQRSLTGSGIHGAQAVRLAVEPLTGAIQLLKMVCIQDCGLPLNRLALKSQINGGMIEALSYGLLEERVIDPDLGVMLNANFDDYRVAGSMEMPELVPLIDDEDTRQEVLGMAEATIIPGHSAIANAIHNACGVRVRDLPLTPDKVLTGLAERG